MKQTPGQISLFSVIWKRYAGCTRGACSWCGNEVAYSAGVKEENIWVDEDYRCSKCGAIFSKADGCIPKDLPLMSGLNNKPIVLIIECTGYTEDDIEKNGGIEWLKHRRCTEWFNSETTRNIDKYIMQRR